MTRLNCILNCLNGLHARPAGYLARLASRFTEAVKFKLYKTSEAIPNPDCEVFNGASIMSLMLGVFEDGAEILLEVEGPCELTAAHLYKTALENFREYDVDDRDGTAARKRLDALLDAQFPNINDPDIDSNPKRPSVFSSAIEKKPHRAVAIINDRLHDIVVAMLPEVARFHSTTLVIAFDSINEGILRFQFTGGEGAEAILEMLDQEIEVGTRITITASEGNAADAVKMLKHVLENLWQCDMWLRRVGHTIKGLDAVAALRDFAERANRLKTSEYAHVQSPFVSRVVTPNEVFINQETSRFQKRDAIEQLISPHVISHGVNFDDAYRSIELSEQSQTVILRDGFAIIHAPVDRWPRIAFSFGVFPSGILWDEEGRTVQLVALVLYARDAWRTWRDYRRRLAILFRSSPELQHRLSISSSSQEFCDQLRTAEATALDEMLSKAK